MSKESPNDNGNVIIQQQDDSSNISFSESVIFKTTGSNSISFDLYNDLLVTDTNDGRSLSLQEVCLWGLICHFVIKVFKNHIKSLQQCETPITANMSMQEVTTSLL